MTTEAFKNRQIFKQLTGAMMNDVTVNWKLVKRRQENDRRYVYSEGIQTMSLLIPLVNNLLLERVEFLRVLKYGVTEKVNIVIYELRYIWKKRSYIVKCD